MISTLLIVGGLVLLFFGGEATVRGASSIATRFRVQPFVVGATVIAFGTSAPELAVTLIAALGGSPDLALGNVVGSNIANTGLILGIAALLRPLWLPRKTLRFELPVVVAVAVLLTLFAWDGFVGLWEGIVLLVGIAWVLLRTLIGARKDRVALETAEPARYRLLVAVPMTLVGLVALYGGGHLLVEGSVRIAEALGVAQWVIGVLVVALGTSMPEVAASVVAAAKGHGDIAVGNVLGSNTFNIFFVLGTGATLHPVTVAVPIRLDLLVYVALIGFAMSWLLSREKLPRAAGAILLLGYLGFVALRVFTRM